MIRVTNTWINSSMAAPKGLSSPRCSSGSAVAPNCSIERKNMHVD
jgi:hypothetical protein